MKAIINVDVTETGNPKRGYHNYDAIIQFQYSDDSTYTEFKERSIVDAITNAANHWMWYTVVNMGKGIYKANYGYDSGD